MQITPAKTIPEEKRMLKYKEIAKQKQEALLIAQLEAEGFRQAYRAAVRAYVWELLAGNQFLRRACDGCVFSIRGTKHDGDFELTDAFVHSVEVYPDLEFWVRVNEFKLTAKGTRAACPASKFYSAKFLVENAKPYCGPPAKTPTPRVKKAKP